MVKINKRSFPDDIEYEVSDDMMELWIDADGRADYTVDVLDESDECDNCGELSDTMKPVCPHCGKRKG